MCYSFYVLFILFSLTDDVSFRFSKYFFQKTVGVIVASVDGDDDENDDNDDNI